MVRLGREFGELIITVSVIFFGMRWFRTFIILVGCFLNNYRFVNIFCF